MRAADSLAVIGCLLASDNLGIKVLNDITAESREEKHQATKICQACEEKPFLKRKLICKIHRTKQRELEKFNLQSFYFILI